MKIEKREFEVYTFNELSEGAKKKALEQFRHINVEGDWHEYVIEERKALLADAGYKDAEIYFSGFCSQGDGASFKAFVEVNTWLQKKAKESKEGKELVKKYNKSFHDADITINITKSGRYEHEETMSVDYYNNMESDKDEVLLDDLAHTILRDAKSRAKAIYQALYDEYDNLTSEQAIIESIEANEYQFLKNGKQFIL